MMVRWIALGLIAALSACVHVPRGELAQESYFPPIGLGQEAVALDRRQKALAPVRRAVVRTQTPNTAVPLEEVVFEDDVTVAPASGAPADAIRTARTIMSSLCLPNARDLTGIAGATTALNIQLFGIRPPIETRTYTLGGKRFGSVAPIRFTPGFSRANPSYGCGVAVRGQDPNTVAQALFADMAAAGLTARLRANSGTGNRVYTVTGGRPDLEVIISTRRAAGKPLTNFVLIHK